MIEFLLILIAGVFLFSFFSVIWLLKRTGEFGRELEGLRRKLIKRTEGEAVTGAAVPETAVVSVMAEREPVFWRQPPVVQAPADQMLVEQHPPATKPAPPEAAALQPALVKPPLPAENTGGPPGGTPRRTGGLAAFIRGGNMWAAGGVLLLLAAFAMFVTYMARRGFFTLEMRIAAAAFSGLAMLASGWVLRKRRPAFFLILQGGGIGVLYLTVFAARKLTGYVPAGAALALMGVLVTAAVIIALFQASQALAFFGFLGGFAAPILLSDGSGRFVFLFASYTILSLGILAIAAGRRGKRPWKFTALLGFAACFGVSGFWVLTRYLPVNFAASEPFFAAFIVIYTALGVMLNRPAEKSPASGASPLAAEDYFETPVIVGTPFLGAVVQWKVFSFIEHGYAIVSFVFAVFYLALAFFLLKKRVRIQPVIIETYGALALLLANLIIPLELSGAFTSAIWAAEGALVYFLGLRRANVRLLCGGLVIHAAAALAFFAGLPGTIYGPQVPLRSAGFTGTIIIAASDVIMLILTRKALSPNGLKEAARLPAFLSRNWFSAVLTVWALLWYFGGWGAELWRIFDGYYRRELFSAWFFTAASGSAVLFFVISKASGVPLLNLAALPSLCAAFLSFLRPVWRWDARYFFDIPALCYNYFDGVWHWAWIAFIVSGALVFFFSGKTITERIRAAWIFAYTLVMLPVLASSLRFLTARLDLASSWTMLAGIGPLLASLLALCVLFPRIARGGEGGRFFNGTLLPRLLCAVAALWFTVTLFMTGNPAPLPLYLPVLNPLELQEALCAAVIVITQLSAKRAGLPALNRAAVFTAGDVLCFLWISAMIARCVHFFGGTPFFRVMDSDAFRLGLFVFWALWGIGHIAVGYRFAIRPVWIAGAILTIMDIAKLILFDMANTGTFARIASFFAAGLALLFIGWAAPLPPARKKEKP